MALLVQLLVEAMGSECLQYDDPKVFTLLRDDLVDLRLCFSICFPDLFNNCKLRVPVENVSVSICLLYTSPSPRDKRQSRMPSSA